MKLTPWMLTVACFLLIAVLAVGFIFKKLTAQVEPPPPRVESRTLPMAITEIAPGTTITRAHVGNGPWRADADLAPDTLTTVDGVIGRIAREPISAAQPLRGSQFYAPGEFPDLEVRPGMRAVTVNVGTDTAMVSGLIKPGQFVDVHLTVSRDAAGADRGALRFSDGSMTVTLFEGVRVVSINRNTAAAGRGDQHNVTLELNKDQSRRLLLGAERGRIALTFNPDGGTAAAPPGNTASDDQSVTLSEVLGLDDPAQPADPWQTENYRGPGMQSLYFRDDRRVGDDAGRNGGGTGVPLNQSPAARNWLSDRSQADESSAAAMRTTPATR